MLHHLLPTIKGIPVLMYHKVWPEVCNKLTITPENLEAHFKYLVANGFETLHLEDFIKIQKNQIQLTDKQILLTFDDGNLCHLEWVYPLLIKYNLKATFFIIGSSLNSSLNYNIDPPDVKMTYNELKLLDPEVVQLGLHSFNHINYEKNTLHDIELDLIKNIQVFEESKLKFFRVLAYPYGARPKSSLHKKELYDIFSKLNIDLAFRIGNKPVKLPIKQPFEIKRIDIWGMDNEATLGIKLKKGKLKPF